MKYFVFISTLDSLSKKWSPYRKLACVGNIAQARKIYKEQCKNIGKTTFFDIQIGRLNKLEESKAYKKAIKLEQEHVDYNIDALISSYCTMCNPFK